MIYGLLNYNIFPLSYDINPLTKCKETLMPADIKQQSKIISRTIGRPLFLDSPVLSTGFY